MIIENKGMNELTIDANISRLLFQFHNERFVIVIKNKKSILVTYFNEDENGETFEDNNMYTVLDWITSRRKEEIEVSDRINMALNILVEKFELCYISDLNKRIVGRVRRQVISYLDSLLINEKWIDVNKYICTYMGEESEECSRH